MDTVIGGSPYRHQHDKSLVGITDPGVDFLVEFASYYHFDAQIGEFF